MHALGSGFIHAANQILINVLRHEGHEGRDDLGQGDQHVVQSGESGFLGVVHTLAPETLAAAAHVPVAQVIHKLGDGAGGFGDQEVGQVFIHGLDQLVQTAEDPLVHQGQLGILNGVILGIEVVDVGIQNKECVGVLQGGHELALAFVHSFIAETAGQPGSACGIEVPANGVRALLVEHRPRIDHVADVLGHLAAFGVLHMTHHDAVFKGSAFKQQGGDGFQRVEPAAGLVDGFGDEVGREALLEDFLVFKGIVPLGEGHGAGIVPAVDNVGHAGHGLAALGAGDLNLIHVGTVQLDLANLGGGHFAQFLLGADYMDVAVLTAPDGQGSAPVAFAAQTPVMHVLQPGAHAAFLDVVGHPVDGAVVGHQLVAHFGHLNVPGGAGIVQQGRVAAPAEGIIVGEGNGGKQQAALLEVGQHQLVSVLHEHAGPLGIGGHAALSIHEVDKGDVVFAAYAVIVLAESGSDMNDAGTIGHGNVVVAYHAPGGLVQLANGKVKQGHVFHAGQFIAGELGSDFGFLITEHGGNQRLGHDVVLAFHGEAAVGVAGVHTQGKVAGQGPGGGGPGQQVGVFFALDLEQHERGGFLHVLVALSHFVAAESGAAAGAVGSDLVAEVEQTLFVDLLEAPPLGLDIIILIGDVGIFHISPEANAVGHLLPLVLVLPDALLALLDEGFDAVSFDLGLAVQTEDLFDLQLNRQAMGIPAGLAQHVLALHGLEARNQVLDGAGLDMADVGTAVRRGRAIKESEALSAVTMVEALLDDVVLLPELQHRFFAFHKVHVRRYFAIHGNLFLLLDFRGNRLSPLLRKQKPPRLHWKRDGKNAFSAVPPILMIRRPSTRWLLCHGSARPGLHKCFSRMAPR